MTRGESRQDRLALVVHPDLQALSKFQSAFAADGVRSVVARDLPTALLAITQHDFDLAVLASRVTEQGDGWCLGGVLRMVFPKATIAVISPVTDVPTLQAAINNGLDQVFEAESEPKEIVDTLLGTAPRQRTTSTAVQ